MKLYDIASVVAAPVAVVVTVEAQAPEAISAVAMADVPEMLTRGVLHELCDVFLAILSDPVTLEGTPKTNDCPAVGSAIGQLNIKSLSFEDGELQPK